MMEDLEEKNISHISKKLPIKIHSYETNFTENWIENPEIYALESKV